MKNAVGASKKFILCGKVWGIFLPIIWIIYTACQLVSFSLTIYKIEDDDGILTAMLCMSGIFCSIILTCSSDAFITNFDAIKTMPLKKEDAVKACIDKTMGLYVIPYLVIFPMELIMAMDYGIVRILTSVCVAVDVIALTGAVYCISFIMRRSEKSNISNCSYALVYSIVYLINGIKALFDKEIFLADGNIADLIIALISGVISVLLYLKARDTAAEKFE